MDGQAAEQKGTKQQGSFLAPASPRTHAPLYLLGRKQRDSLYHEGAVVWIVFQIAS